MVLLRSTSALPLGVLHLAVQSFEIQASHKERLENEMNSYSDLLLLQRLLLGMLTLPQRLEKVKQGKKK